MIAGHVTAGLLHLDNFSISEYAKRLKKYGLEVVTLAEDQMRFAKDLSKHIAEGGDERSFYDHNDMAKEFRKNLCENQYLILKSTVQKMNEDGATRYLPRTTFVLERERYKADVAFLFFSELTCSQREIHFPHYMMDAQHFRNASTYFDMLLQFESDSIKDVKQLPPWTIYKGFPLSLVHFVKGFEYDDNHYIHPSSIYRASFTIDNEKLDKVADAFLPTAQSPKDMSGHVASTLEKQNHVGENASGNFLSTFGGKPRDLLRGSKLVNNCDESSVVELKSFLYKVNFPNCGNEDGMRNLQSVQRILSYIAIEQLIDSKNRTFTITVPGKYILPQLIYLPIDLNGRKLSRSPIMNPRSLQIFTKTTNSLNKDGSCSQTYEYIRAHSKDNPAIYVVKFFSQSEFEELIAGAMFSAFLFPYSTEQERDAYLEQFKEDGMEAFVFMRMYMKYIGQLSEALYSGENEHEFPADFPEARYFFDYVLSGSFGLPMTFFEKHQSRNTPKFFSPHFAIYLKSDSKTYQDDLRTMNVVGHLFPGPSEHFKAKVVEKNVFLQVPTEKTHFLIALGGNDEFAMVGDYKFTEASSVPRIQFQGLTLQGFRVGVRKDLLAYS